MTKVIESTVSEACKRAERERVVVLTADPETTRKKILKFNNGVWPINLRVRRLR